MSKARCLEIISILESEIRFWGRYVDEFTQDYMSLSNAEKADLAKGTAVSTRYNFLCQVLEHALRELASSDFSERRKILRWCFVLLNFENFEFDYRENTLRLSALFKITKDFDKLQSQVWLDVEDSATERVVGYLATMKGSPVPFSKKA